MRRQRNEHNYLAWAAITLAWVCYLAGVLALAGRP